MTLLHQQNFTCPYCDIFFSAKVLGSYNTFGKQYSDFYQSSSINPQPILYFIQLCPFCGFAAFTLDYKDFSINLERVERAIDRISKIAGKEPTAFTTGEGYLEIAEYKNNLTLEQKAHIQMQAGYAYRELNDAANLKKSREIALETIEKILVEKSFNNHPKELYCYLAGELNRLLGEKEKATNFYHKAIDAAPDNSFIMKIATKQLNKPENIIPDSFRKNHN
jgi:tetratricopeptide (TPR) repeat protein